MANTHTHKARFAVFNYYYKDDIMPIDFEWTDFSRAHAMVTALLTTVGMHFKPNYLVSLYRVCDVAISEQ